MSTSACCDPTPACTCRSSSAPPSRATGQRGLGPGFVVATAGTTNTGAVDPLPLLADACAAEGLWLHVDGAYGAPVALCPAGQKRSRASSAPTRWSSIRTRGCSSLTTSAASASAIGVLGDAYAMAPEYLLDVSARSGEVDFRNRSLEPTRAI